MKLVARFTTGWRIWRLALDDHRPVYILTAEDGYVRVGGSSFAFCMRVHKSCVRSGQARSQWA